MQTWIKFCGTTSLEDALASIEAGASALGFIFAPSKRRITIEKAGEIVRALPPHVERIGVFVDGTIDEISETVTRVGLTGMQLHGGGFARDVYHALPRERRHSLRIIRTVLVDGGFAQNLKKEVTGATWVDAWLLDSGAGSGKTFDWCAARADLGQRSGRFIIAGGLTAENVGEAIEVFSPWGVDVVSGIEAEPGRKDHEKMKAFVAAVRRAEQS